MRRFAQVLLFVALSFVFIINVSAQQGAETVTPAAPAAQTDAEAFFDLSAQISGVVTLRNGVTP